MNDDIIIKMISSMISEDKNDIPNAKSINRYNIVESVTNKIIIRIVGRNGEPYKDLIADYCRYATSPKSKKRYLIAGNNITADDSATAEKMRSKQMVHNDPINIRSKNTWLYSLRDFYKLKLSEYYGATRQMVVPVFDKIMTIKAENIISITKPDQVTQ
jgi:hypothetical protein